MTTQTITVINGPAVSTVVVSTPDQPPTVAHVIHPQPNTPSNNNDTRATDR
jgi:alpha/beta superfamily hydrolase